MIGVQLGPWVIEAEIGRGGMGTVYRARRGDGAAPGPPVAAVKVLAAELAVEVGFQQRFGREIAILEQLDHPHIVRFYDSGESNRRFWYAMELIDGPSYDSLRDGRGRMPWVDVLTLALQVCPALKHAHDRGVIHRDLKPANILRASTPEGSPFVKLTDFGIASLFASPHLTVTGGVIGTPEFLSPEQATGKPATRRSDLYSLGIVLYTLVTGAPPFTGDAVDLLHKHRFGQFDRPSRIIPELPPDFDAIICELLEKDPDRRPGDAAVLYRRLDSLRKKLQRQSADDDPATRMTRSASGREGPATMVSRMVREELEQQNKGGPIRRLLNNPMVVALLFVLCVGTLVYVLWPDSAATLYRKGAALMASNDFDDHERAFERYFARLEARYPDHPYQEEVAQLREQYEAERAERQARGGAMRLKGRVTEAQWFYEKGMRQRRAGDTAGGRRTLEALVEAFREVPSERPWVRRAEAALEQPAEPDGWQSLRAAVDRAIALENEGQRAEAKAIRDALAALYKDDPKALAVIRGR